MTEYGKRVLSIRFELTEEEAVMLLGLLRMGITSPDRIGPPDVHDETIERVVSLAVHQARQET